MGPRRSPEMSGGLAGCALRGFRSVADFDFDAAPKPPQAVLIPVKSKFGVEFRRTSILLEPLEQTFDNFLALICDLHNVKPDEEGNLEELVLSYTSSNGDTLPISNDDNLRFCLHSRLPLLRLSLQRKSESYEEQQGYGKVGRGRSVTKKNRVTISNPQDFRRVSSILDANVLPRQLRRVELCKYYTNKPLGFYIKEGYSERATPYGIMATTGIFISRLLENGLAASTNLLSKGDEILEVNGIDVTGRAIDQVTDMMHANAKNLILTVKPVTETHPALPIPATYLMPPPPMYTHVPMPFFGFPAPPPASEIACPNRIRTYDQSLKEIHRKMAKSVLIEVDPVYRPPGYRFHDENKRNSTSYSSGDQSTSSRSTSGRFTPKLAVPDLNHNRRSMFCASNNQTLNPPQTGQKTSFETFSRNSTLRVEDKANPASIRSPRSLLRSQNHEKRPFSVHFDPRVVRGAQSPSHLTVF
ncbi:hypothetical protein L596_011097 [Steinernema carpocapsae]|uniref:PDZ domain-containing protein n=1 Tax=Steinernema carpocapsae TaxID=34508 RepID=A0A4U5NS74_STECR|nr:hypothetical protein L596_011097 [Steinernema carpocapsae]